jgi:hypothetical protein
MTDSGAFDNREDIDASIDEKDSEALRELGGTIVQTISRFAGKIK